MKKYILTLTALSCCFFVKAQIPDDALRNSFFTQNGTARNMAIGGAMGSLGGDITANNVNPAGIGLFKTNEFVFSPGFALNNNKFNFRGDNSSNKKNAFSYGATGFIFGGVGRQGSRFSSSAFSISVNQLASFNNRTFYKGKNDISSFSEQFLEELAKDNASPSAAENNYIFGSSLAFRTYLIDSFMTNGRLGYQSQASVARPGVEGVNQENEVTSKGGYHEISLAAAANMSDRLYFGGSLNIPVIYYQRDRRFKESDATTNPNNNFNYFEFTEKSTSRGVGINAKLGMIYKPQEYFRLGLALHTPSFLSFRDNIRAALTTDTEKYTRYGTLTETSDNLNSDNAGDRQYNMTTPWRVIGSASYVLREVNDTRQQSGFITADVEYVNYRSARFYSSNAGDATGVNYYQSLNDKIKDYYKGAINFKLGGELKFNTIMVRAGGAFYGNPYTQSNDLKARRVQGSGGLGYRNHGMFIDLTYVHNFIKDVNFPYRLNDKPNTFAEQTGSRGNVIATLGFKF